MHDSELDQFKRSIHLVQYAVDRHGYVRDPRESSRASHVMRQASTHDKVIMRQNAEGHWTYFSVRDSGDSGTIVDFVQHRGTRSLGEVRQELRQWLGTARPPFELATRPHDAPLPGRTSQERPGVAEAFATARAAENSPYLNARGIRPETLRDERFAGTWRLDARSNVLFAHRDEAGALTGFEIKNRGFTGFSSGGRKAAWQSTGRPDDRTLVITESAIDALSHHQLHRTANARYLSTAGTLSVHQHTPLHAILGNLPRAATVAAAVDADEGGAKLATDLKAIVAQHAHLAFTRHSPSLALGKDWNEVLQRTERDYIRSLPAAVRRLTQSPERSR